MVEFAENRVKLAPLHLMVQQEHIQCTVFHILVCETDQTVQFWVALTRHQVSLYLEDDSQR